MNLNVKKFKASIDNFFGWVKKTELVELDDIDVTEDPVRPELDVEWRTSYGRKIYGLKYKTRLKVLYVLRILMMFLLVLKN